MIAILDRYGQLVGVRGGTHTIHPRCIVVVTTYDLDVIVA
jgi:hypothetical protein